MACPQHLQNQLKEKEARGEELTETQQEIVNADDDDLNDAVPKWYGPLAPNDAGYCKFCFGVGELGAIAFSTATYFGLRTFTEVPAETTPYAAIGVWLALAIIVGYTGYFPILGPKLGPIVEKLLAKGGIYITATARKNEGVGPWENGDAVTDGGTTTETIDDFDLEIDDVDSTENDQFDLPEDYLDAKESEVDRLRQQKEQLQDRLDDYKEMLKEERSNKQEIREKKKELEETKKQKETQLEQAEKEKQQAEENVDQLQAVIEDNANWGVPLGDDAMPDPNDALPCIQPLHSENFEFGNDFGGAFGGLRLHLRTVEIYMEKFQQSVEVSYGVSHPDDITEIPDAREIPTTLDDTEIPEHEEFLWPDPRNLETPIDFTHPGKTGYDPDEGHTVLFWQDFGKVRDARKGVIGDDDTDHYMTPVVIAWDSDDNFVPPPWDTRGFERVQQLRSQNDEYSRMIDQMRGKLQQQNRRIDALQNKLTVKETEVEDLDNILERQQEREKRATKAAKSNEQGQRVQEAAIETLEEEMERAEAERDLAMKSRRKEKKKRIEESDDVHEMQIQAENNRNRQERVAKWVPNIRDIYDKPDWEAVDDPSREYDESDVFQEFMQDDNLSSQTAEDLKQKILKNELLEG